MILFALLFFSNIILTTEVVKDEIIRLEMYKRIITDPIILEPITRLQQQKIMSLSMERSHPGSFSAQEIMKGVCKLSDESLWTLRLTRLDEQKNKTSNILLQAQNTIIFE